MTVLERIAGLWFAVLEASASAAADLTSRLSTRQRLSVVSREADELMVYPEGRTAAAPLSRIALQEPGAPAGRSRVLRRSHVTLELDPAQVVFRTIDLPGQATDFIEAIVRTQIDRLTPWRPEQVVFGWTPPARDAETSGITLTVAATARDRALPLMARIQALGAAVVVARVALPGAADRPAAEPVRTIELARSTAPAFAVAFWRRVLGAATAVTVVLVIGSTLYAEIETFQLASAEDDLAQRSATTRALVARGTQSSDPASAARRFVDQRKTEVPFATLVLETVSRTLPDDTFLTSFDLTGPRLRLIGFTKNAPALIRIIDSAAGLSGATFFAPTTKLPDDPADRFNIEATAQPGQGATP